MKKPVMCRNQDILKTSRFHMVPQDGQHNQHHTNHMFQSNWATPFLHIILTISRTDVDGVLYPSVMQVKSRVLVQQWGIALIVWG